MSSPRHRLPPSVLVPAAMGVLLRLYELVAFDRAPLLAEGLAALLWSSVPFGIAVLMALAPRLQAAAVGFASASLVASFYAHYVIYSAPSPGAGSALIVLLPLWCVLFVGPTGALVAWRLARRRANNGAA